MPYSRIALGAGVVAFAAGATTVAVTFSVERIPGIALVLMVIGTMVISGGMLTKIFRGVTRPADDAYELGYQIGYDKGFLEGHRAARPVVVPMASRSTCLTCDDEQRRQRLIREALDVHPETAVG